MKIEITTSVIELINLTVAYRVTKNGPYYNTLLSEFTVDENRPGIVRKLTKNMAKWEDAEGNKDRTPIEIYIPFENTPEIRDSLEVFNIYSGPAFRIGEDFKDPNEVLNFSEIKITGAETLEEANTVVETLQRELLGTCLVLDNHPKYADVSEFIHCGD